MSRRAKIDYVNNSLVLVRGYQIREALMELKHGRAPLWSRQNQAWTCQPKTAAALTVLLERAGYEVTITGSPMRSASRTGSSTGTVVPAEEGVAQAGHQSADDAVGLW